MQMTACNLATLIANLPPQQMDNEADSFAKKEKYPWFRDTRAHENKHGEGIPKQNFSENDFLTHPRYELELAARFQITEPSTRNERLKALVHHVYFQVWREAGRRIAELQYKNKTVETDADLATHLRDFDAFWASCEKNLWEPQLSEADQVVLSQLTAMRDREAYRIFHSFNLFATEQGNSDFPIAVDSVARRLSFTRQAAGKLIRRYTIKRIIEKTKDYVPHVMPARYRWLVGTTPSTSSTDNSSVDVPAAVVPASPDLAGAAEIHCDPSAESSVERTAAEIMANFGEQIIALLSLNGPLSPEALRTKIVSYEKHREACEYMLRRFVLQLTIDINSEGQYRLGPEKGHFKLLMAQQLLKQLAISGITDSEPNLESLSSHFGIDIDDLKRARDALLELGDLKRSESNRLLAITEPIPV